MNADDGAWLEGTAVRRLASPWLGPLLVLATAAMGWALLDRLPERVPTHWGVDGRPNGWMSPAAAIGFMPALIGGLWAFLLALGRYLPGVPRSGLEWRAYVLLCNTVLLFMALLQAVVLASAAGAAVDPSRWAMPMVGLLLLLIGRLVPHLPEGGVNLPVGDPEYRASVARFVRRVFTWGGAAIAAVGLLVPPPLGTWAGFWLIIAVSLLPLGHLVFRPPPVRRPPGGWRGGSTSSKERSP